MELAPSLLLGLLGFSLKACQRLAFKKLQDDDTKHKTLLHLIVSRIDEVALLIKNQKKWQLKTSLQEFQTGLKYLEKELNNQNRDQVEKTPRAELKMNNTFVEASSLTETIMVSVSEDASTKVLFIFNSARGIFSTWSRFCLFNSFSCVCVSDTFIKAG